MVSDQTQLEMAQPVVQIGLIDKDMQDDEPTQLDLAKVSQTDSISLPLSQPPSSAPSTHASSSSHLSNGTPFVLTTANKENEGTPKISMASGNNFTTDTAQAPILSFQPKEGQEEEKKESSHGKLQSQSSVLSTGGGIALSGRNKLSLGFYDLNSDFALPPDFKLVKKLGKGAYGRVMQIINLPSQREYACKRYEHVFSDTQRARRLLREMNILKRMTHPCCNRLLCVIPPGNVLGDRATPIQDLKFNEVYLVLRKCDMDLKKLIKSGKHLEETQVKSIVYDILCGLNYLHKAKIIHRDLKPGNILVNNDCTIQICDFGLARSMDGIYRQQVEEPSEEAIQENPDAPMDLGLVPQTSLDSNSAMTSQMSGSANKEAEGEGKTPKANLRQERIVNTRPGLLVHQPSLVSLTTINEESQYSEATTLRHQDATITDWPDSKIGPSSEMKSQKKGNLLEDGDVPDQRQSQGEVSSEPGIQFNFDIDKELTTGLRGEDAINATDAPLNQESITQTTLEPMPESQASIDQSIDASSSEQKVPVIPQMPQSMVKQTSLLKTSGDKQKKKGALKVGFSFAEEQEEIPAVANNQKQPTLLKRQQTEQNAPEVKGKLFKKPKLVSSKTESLGTKKMKLSKELTRHVVTRWYRAPEVILMNEFYSYSIDMWSVGCIFAELMSMMKDNFDDPFSRVPLFPGKSCYPLSPGTAINQSNMSKEEREKGDQLNKIFEVIGTPSPDEQIEDFLESAESVEYVRKLPARPRADLAEKYPATDRGGIALLQRMLEFNPNKRPTAQQALEDPYFDDIRLPEQERFETPVINLPVDDEGCGDMSLEELKRMIVEEINKLDSDKFDFENDYEEECEDY